MSNKAQSKKDQPQKDQQGQQGQQGAGAAEPGLPEGSGAGVDDSFSQLADAHVGAMPEPSEEAIQAEETDRAQSEASSGLKDDYGTPFDPSIHKTDAEGEPVKTKGGRWAKRPGRKSGQSPESSLNRPRSPSQAAPEAYQPDTYKQSAEATVDSIGMIGLMLGGNDFAFRQYADPQSGKIVMDERQNGIQAFERYYREKGIKDIPPGLAITIWALSYAGTRFTQSPTARSKAKLTWEWVKSKFSRKPKKKETESERKAEGE